MLTIIVNGERVSAPQGTTVRQLVERLGLGDAACAVEIDGHLVRHADHASHAVRDGQRVEIVTLVGGG